MTTYSESRILHHHADDLYTLVSDVGAYPEFLPWCLAARVRSHSETDLVADLAVGFRLYRERFTSYATLDRQQRLIKVNYADGPFKYMCNSWHFKNHKDGCEVDFHIDFEFQSHFFQSAIESLFSEAVKKMVGAFETRADALYGAK